MRERDTRPSDPRCLLLENGTEMAHLEAVTPHTNPGYQPRKRRMHQSASRCIEMRDGKYSLYEKAYTSPRAQLFF